VRDSRKKKKKKKKQKKKKERKKRFVTLTYYTTKTQNFKQWGAQGGIEIKKKRQYLQ